MFARDTILARREAFEVPTETSEGDPRHIYNRVKVIGPSPVAMLGGQVAEWQSGPGAQGVVITPLDGFGGNLDRPLGELQKDYFIEAEPERTITEQKIRVIDANTSEAGPTPEEVFAESERETLVVGKPRRKR